MPDVRKLEITPVLMRAAVEFWLNETQLKQEVHVTDVKAAVSSAGGEVFAISHIERKENADEVD